MTSPKKKTRPTKGASFRKHWAKTRERNAVARGHAAKRANVQPAAFHLEEARHYLGGFSVPTMHRLIERGLLRPNRSTRNLLFPIHELDRFLKEGQCE